MNKILLCVVFFYTVYKVNAQDTVQNNKPKIDFSGYFDTYYSYDFSQPDTAKKLPFLYNYSKQNEFNVNIALLRAFVSYQNVYAKVSIHSGTYVDENYKAESLKLLNEAYVGMYLGASKKTTIEAGILPSYIGFESAISHVNLTATRSVLAENSPYYMAGVKVSHQFNDKISGSFFVTNGWQRIQKPMQNLIPSFGTQLIYNISENSFLNWSTFAGKEAYRTMYSLRFFNNFYWDKKWNKKWHSITGFDWGFQEVSTKKDGFKNWFSPVLITQYTLCEKWQIAHRIEYYDDKFNVMIPYEVPFQTFGNSINVDFLANSKTKIRTEARWFHASEFIFDGKKDNVSLTTTMSFEF